eukprot:4801776-Amphidinium_carterae.1
MAAIMTRAKSKTNHKSWKASCVARNAPYRTTNSSKKYVPKMYSTTFSVYRGVDECNTRNHRCSSHLKGDIRCLDGIAIVELRVNPKPNHVEENHAG